MSLLDTDCGVADAFLRQIDNEGAVEDPDIWLSVYQRRGGGDTDDIDPDLSVDLEIIEAEVAELWINRGVDPIKAGRALVSDQGRFDSFIHETRARVFDMRGNALFD